MCDPKTSPAKLEDSCRIKRPRLVQIVDGLCLVLLVGTTVYATCRYAALPDRIPVHYNAKGVIDGYGSKGMIWLFVAIMWFVVGVISVAELFPKHWNTVVAVTKENRVRIMTLTWKLASTTKLAVAIIYSYLAMAIIRGGNVSPLFLRVILLTMGFNIAYWITRIFANRRGFPTNSLPATTNPKGTNP
jgi:uncharacterized membrane protein